MPVALNPIEIEQVLVNLICNAFESYSHSVPTLIESHSSPLRICHRNRPFHWIKKRNIYMYASMNLKNQLSGDALQLVNHC